MDKDRIKITTNPPLFKIVPTWHFIMQLIRRAFELSVLVPAYLYVKDNLEQIERDKEIEFDIGRSTIVYSVDEHNTIHLITDNLIYLNLTKIFMKQLALVLIRIMKKLKIVIISMSF